VIVPLRNQIADGFWPAFQRRTDVPVTTTALDPLGEDVVGSVVGGVVVIDAGAPPDPGSRVAWMVDLGAEIG
jgi:hypothetical protein